MTKFYVFIALATAVLMTGCATQSRYSQRIDSAPAVLIENHEPSEIIPRYEPYRLENLRPYTIAGVGYRPLLTGHGYVEEGIASWYGQKFHGHLTANGEIFDMYEHTAAHKTLPLPSFAKVTNLKNGKSILVRINDRGPFHANRIIDLSFAAAKTLDFLDTGTAEVKVEVIHVDKNNLVTVGDNAPVTMQEYLGPSPMQPSQHIKKYYIQVMAAKNLSALETIGTTLKTEYETDFTLLNRGDLFRLKLGPFDDFLNANHALTQLKDGDYPQAFVVFE